jgi:hydroxypyruvate reductase
MSATARDHALAIYHAALEAVKADRLLKEAVRLEDCFLLMGAEIIRLAEVERIFVVGAGKASVPMAAALEEVLGERLTAGVVVTKYGHGGPTRRIRVMEAAHPVPDAGSIAAGAALVELAGRAEEQDLVICLLSGGASALMEMPADGITLEDFRAVTDLLLRAGATIWELNAVRACLSGVKAGGLARAAAPARVVCLVLSDVLGDDLAVIGSGPCVYTYPDHARALDVLERRGIEGSAPESVRAALSRPAPAPVTLEQGRSTHTTHMVIGNIHSALHAACSEADRRGLPPVVLTSRLEGEAREVGKVVGGIAATQAVPSRSGCWILGGETTVTVRGPGKGGRCQEIIAAALPYLPRLPWVALLAAGTDGTDGPTDAAGALADGETLARAEAAGGSLASALQENNTYAFLDAAGALIRTGPTNSNVGDLVIIVTEGREPRG